uniref:Uncharacterized protein n=1 Tax=Pyropia pulchra TaxID=60925 RepID=O24669_9RHOD|nr:ORF2 [Pyropia pulchra]
MTFGVLESKEAYPACANMQGKVFNISMNEDTYYKICRRLRMTFGLTMFILFCLTLYLIFKIVIGILNSRRKHREELAFYNNLRNEHLQIMQVPGYLCLLKKKIYIYK